MLTVLSSAHARPATKRHTPAGTVPYAREKLWHWREVPIPNFAALAEELVRLESDRTSLIVQGKVAPAWRGETIIRRTKRGENPSLIDEGSDVLHLDIDGIELPVDTGWDNPAGVARAVWSDLGKVCPALQGVAVHWQASSSAAMPGKDHLAKLHFWCLADRPLDEAFRRALLNLAGADGAVASINTGM